MIQLAAEHLKICPFSLALAGLKRISLSALSQQEESENQRTLWDEKEGNRNNTIPMSTPGSICNVSEWCIHRVVSWPPVPMNTVVLSLPAMIGTNIDPRISLSRDQPWDSDDLHIWYPQPTHRLIYNWYSNQCQPTAENPLNLILWPTSAGSGGYAWF